MTPLDYALLGLEAVFAGPAAFSLLGLPIPITPLMVLGGFLLGILVGATPGLAGPMAMAVSLPILISVFGFTPDALLPVLGFLIGIMKGATLGGAVPAILFNTPGTPDAYMTTLDGHPMARKGQGRLALKVAHFSSASGDTISDIVLIVCAPFLAIAVEAYLDLPEKTALLILSMAFIAAVIGASPAKGAASAALGLLVAYVGTGEDFNPRLTGGMDTLGSGFTVASVVLGVLILGEVFRSIEDLARGNETPPLSGDGSDARGNARLSRALIARLAPTIGRSALLGTAIGALPGIGSTLAATLGYSLEQRRAGRATADPPLGEGNPNGVAATEAANSAVSGANLIPVLSLGIPGNAAAVFLVLAMDSIGGFNPGPSVFRFTGDVVNPELVVAFGLFAMMMLANAMNWTIGGAFMRAVGVMTRVPKSVMLPVVLLLTLTAIYIQETSFAALWFTVGFGVLGYLMRRADISPLPFVIAFILAGTLELTARQAFSATGGDPWFLFSSWTSTSFMALAVVVVALACRRRTA